MLVWFGGERNVEGRKILGKGGGGGKNPGDFSEKVKIGKKGVEGVSCG